jgi:hypothetical protein
VSARLRSLTPRQRRAIGGVLLVGLLVLLATHGSAVLPSTLRLALPLSDPERVSAVELSLVDSGGEGTYHLRQRFAGDAPETLRVEAEVLAGRYDVHLRVTRGGSSAALVGTVEAPADGEIRLHLHAAE